VNRARNLLVAALLVALLQGCANFNISDADFKRAVQENPGAFIAGLGCAAAGFVCYAVADNQSIDRNGLAAYGAGIGFDVLALVFFAYTFKDIIVGGEGELKRKWDPYTRR
jgi:hypothetical protein